MADRTPYILLTFANPHQVPREYLPFLHRESARVYEALEKFALEDTCDVNRIPDATVEMIFNTIEKWQKRKDLILFHYGGHASGQELLLVTDGGASRAANAQGLAELLGSLPDLQLVFLNGCSTRGQVRLLLEQGVKAVIATSEPVQDQMAVDFASRFYQNLAEGDTIGNSFQQARKFVRAKYNRGVLTPEESRSFLLEMFSREDDESELPWGIYHQPGGEEVLEWRLPQNKLNRSAAEIEEETRRSNELLDQIRQGIDALRPVREAGERSRRRLFPLAGVLAVVLCLLGYFSWQSFTASRTFDLGILMYGDEEKAMPVSEGSVRVIYDGSPEVNYPINGGRIEVKDLSSALRGGEIKLQPSVEGFSEEQVALRVPESGGLLEVVLTPKTFASGISGTVKKADGSPLTGAAVMVGNVKAETNELGDFTMVVPVAYGARQRMRIIHNNIELYNGEEVISPNSIRIMVRN